MNAPQTMRSNWSGRWAFILVTVGSAIGLGNIWKFPYMTGTNGGSAFVLIYLLCILAIGVPLLMAETMLGRRGQGNPIATMVTLSREAGAGSYWKVIGIFGVSGALMILSFYSVVAGWLLEYNLRALSGFQGLTKTTAGLGFASLLADPLRMIGWHSVFMAMTIAVVAGGVTRGIERANKIMIPALSVIMILIIGYGIMAADMPSAFRFMFHFDSSQVTQDVVFSAMGHAFFTLSLGMGSIMTYGSYLGRSTSIGRTCIYIALVDTTIALLSGLAIFAIVFAQGLEPAAGPGLILQTLPLAFSQMPAGQVIGPLFFLLVVFAAWTSSISLLEPSVALLIEKFAMPRKLAACAIGGAVWMLGIAVCLSFNHWSEVKLFELGIFDLLDAITTKVIMPLSGMLIAVFVGWVMHRRHVRDEIALTGGSYHLWLNTLRFVSPIAITVIFLHVSGIIK